MSFEAANTRIADTEAIKVEEGTCRRIPYQQPEFTSHNLRVVTLGGTFGGGDSDPNTEIPGTSSASMEEWDDYEDDGWGNGG